MSYYRQTRNCELSTLKFIEDSLATDWSGVNLVKSWSALDNTDIPVICVILDDTSYQRKELGATLYRETYMITIDIYASSDGMRLDLSDWLLNTLNAGWTYYQISLDSGNNRQISYTEAGRCRINEILSNTKVDLSPMGDVKEKFRQNIVINVTVGC
jgi:hypothetical protein